MNNRKTEVSVDTYEQFKALMDEDIRALDFVGLIMVDSGLTDVFTESDFDFIKANNCYLALPYVLRKRNTLRVKSLLDKASDRGFKGVMVRNTEELSLVKSEYPRYKVISDAGLYTFNKRALEAMLQETFEVTLPYELNRHERADLTKALDEETLGRLSMVVYGRIPMMISANCLYKTSGDCDSKGKHASGILTDRLHNDFPVVRHCADCYNVIFNCLPLSLHKNLEVSGNLNLRLVFTTEDSHTTKEVLKAFDSLIKGDSGDITDRLMNVLPGYTKGYEKRGVE